MHDKPIGKRARVPRGTYTGLTHCPHCGVERERYCDHDSFGAHISKCSGKRPVLHRKPGSMPDTCPKCGISASLFSPHGSQASFRHHLADCTGLQPEHWHFKSYVLPDKCPTCGVRKSKYSSLRGFKYFRKHIRGCKGKKPSVLSPYKGKGSAASYLNGHVHKTNHGSWQTTVAVQGRRYTRAFKSRERAEIQKVRMMDRAREVLGGLVGTNEKAIRKHILRLTDPYEWKDQMRRTWTERAKIKLRGLPISHPRAIFLPGFRPHARKTVFTQPYLGTVWRVVMVEREPGRCTLGDDSDVIVGDFFNVLYEKACETAEGKRRGRQPETRFSFVDYDVCASPSDIVLQPVIDLIDAGPAVLTSPCALRVITATPPKNERLAREAHESRQALVEAIAERAEVLDYDTEGYTSTGMQMVMQQWVLQWPATG